MCTFSCIAIALITNKQDTFLQPTLLRKSPSPSLSPTSSIAYTHSRTRRANHSVRVIFSLSFFFFRSFARFTIYSREEECIAGLIYKSPPSPYCFGERRRRRRRRSARPCTRTNRCSNEASSRTSVPDCPATVSENFRALA